MTDAWFAGADLDDPEPGATRVRTGNASAPTDWPAEVADAGFVVGEGDYYAKLRSTTLVAASEAVAERGRADNMRLIHATRAIDDAEQTINELTEQAVEWTGTLYEEVPRGLNGVRDIVVREPKITAEEHVVSYAICTVDPLGERDDPRTFIEEHAPATALNPARTAGPVPATRLIALAGGLKPLVEKPSGTVQVLGTEGTLFAHLKGRAMSPKRGVILTHKYVHGIRPGDRRSAARALARKLAIATRVDHYSGNYQSDLHAELVDRMETIRTRADEGGDK